MKGHVTGFNASAVLLLGILSASSGEPTPGPLTMLSVQEPDPYVGEQMCARCHEDVHRARSAVVHGSGGAPELAEKRCQSCHGPGRQHVQRPDDPKLTPSIDRMTLAQRNALCTDCHEKMPAFDPTHEAANVSCSGCHIFHQLRAGIGAMGWQPNCLSCHAGSKAFDELHEYDMDAMASGTISCRDCHKRAHGK